MYHSHSLTLMCIFIFIFYFFIHFFDVSRARTFALSRFHTHAYAHIIIFASRVKYFFVYARSDIFYLADYTAPSDRPYFCLFVTLLSLKFVLTSAAATTEESHTYPLCICAPVNSLRRDNRGAFIYYTFGRDASMYTR